jgi:glycosyltransferase involved in cell wall biosynthesis
MEQGNSKPQVIVAQLGARMHYAVPALLQRAEMLAHFYTDTYVGRGSALNFLLKVAPLIPKKFCPQAMKRLLARREDSLPPEKVTAFNMLGIRYAWSLSRAHSRELVLRAYTKYGLNFCESVLREKLPEAQAIYAFGGAALLFQHLQGLKMRRILEQVGAPMAVFHQILSEDHRLWPGWDLPDLGPEEYLAGLDRERKEWELAEAIICASEFVAQGLYSQGVPREKIHVIPYGVEVSRFATLRSPYDGSRPLRLLFVGEVGLGKGCQYLHQALGLLSPGLTAARLVGHISILEPYRSLLKQRVEFVGHVPRSEVSSQYGWGDLFVFPSLCEGFGIVICEAMAAGLPVITTPNVGSVVRDGVDGFIVPIRDSQALAEKIELLAADPDLLARMSENARQRAQEFSWERYGERLISILKNILA